MSTFSTKPNIPVYCLRSARANCADTVEKKEFLALKSLVQTQQAKLLTLQASVQECVNNYVALETNITTLRDSITQAIEATKLFMEVVDQLYSFFMPTNCMFLSSVPPETFFNCRGCYQNETGWWGSNEGNWGYAVDYDPNTNKYTTKTTPMYIRWPDWENNVSAEKGGPGYTATEHPNVWDDYTDDFETTVTPDKAEEHRGEQHWHITKVDLYTYWCQHQPAIEDVSEGKKPITSWDQIGGEISTEVPTEGISQELLENAKSANANGENGTSASTNVENAGVKQ